MWPQAKRTPAARMSGLLVSRPRQLQSKGCCRYFLTPQEEIRKHLEETDAEAKKQSTSLLEQREVLEKQTKAAEAELRELLQHSPALARALASHEG